MIIKPGGSERGWSYWSSVSACPLAHWRKYHENEYVPHFPDPGTEKKPEARMIGTIFGAFREQNARKLEGPLRFENQRLTLEDYPYEYAEAARCDDAYRNAYPSLDICAAELELVATSEQLAFYGVPTLTGRADAIVRWPGGELGPNMAWAAPGLYMWDYKTSDKRDEAKLLNMYRTQMLLYQELYNATHDEPVIGAVLDVVAKTKTVQCFRLMVPRPVEQDKINIAETLSLAYVLREQHGQQRNITGCPGKFGRECQYYTRCWGT